MANDDLIDLRERLRSIRTGNHGKLVTILGSGMSNSSLPSTTQMTLRFLDVLGPSSRAQFESRVPPGASASERYQAAAHFLARQRGEMQVTTVIRSAIAEATSALIESSNDASLQAAFLSPAWDIPRAHRSFADYYSRLSGDLQGPIFTTNFDPFIELALREVGIESQVISVPFDATTTAAELEGMTSIPVVHVHGFFTGGWSLNSADQLARARPFLEELISSQLADASVLVLGYGGWDDAVMRVLRRQIDEHTAVSAEIIWAAHGGAEGARKSNPSLEHMYGSPGFQLYGDIDAEELFDAGTATSLARSQANSLRIRGYTQLPIEIDEISSPTLFSEGALPTWSDAIPGQWPEMSPTSMLGDEIERALSRGESAVLGAIGPMGEGKSTGLRQLAMRFSDQVDVSVLWREQGAPRLDPDRVAEVLQLGPTIVFIDEADRAQDDILTLLSAETTYPLVIVLAAQDRLWWTIGRSVTDRVDPVLFDGLSDVDAAKLARRWAVLGISVGPDGKTDTPVEDVTSALKSAAGRAGNHRRSSLFGAILEVRESSSLAARVAHLMEALATQPVRNSLPFRVPGSVAETLSMADVFGGICVMQHFVDTEGAFLRGATREVIGNLVNEDDEQYNAAVLRALGREASITFSANRVYARHPMIAAAAVEWMAKTDRLRIVCRLLGRAGARLRAAGEDRREYEDAYSLAARLPTEVLAVSAAHGAIEGAPNYLQPRITYLSVIRKFDPEKATKYADEVGSEIWGSRDRDTAIRVLLNEMAVVAINSSEFRKAIGLASLSLHNGTGRPLLAEQASYAFGALARAHRALLVERPGDFTGSAQLIKMLSERLIKMHHRYVEPELHRVTVPDEVRRLSTRTALDHLARDLSPFAKQVVKDLSLPFGPGTRQSPSFNMPSRPDFSDMEQLEGQ